MRSSVLICFLILSGCAAFSRYNPPARVDGGSVAADIEKIRRLYPDDCMGKIDCYSQPVLCKDSTPAKTVFDMNLTITFTEKSISISKFDEGLEFVTLRPYDGTVKAWQLRQGRAAELKWDPQVEAIFRTSVAALAQCALSKSLTGTL